MSRFSNGEWANLVVTLLIAGLVAGVVTGAVVQGQSDGAASYSAQASAYCYQTTGSPALSQEYVVGNHGGLHCMFPGNEHHLHDVTDEALLAAYVANQTGGSVDWSTVDRYEPWYKRGFWPDILTFVFVALVVVLISVAAKVAPRRIR